MKICPVAAELCHLDGQSDRQTYIMKLTVALQNFTNNPNKDKGAGP